MKDICIRIKNKNKPIETELPLTISAQYGLIDQKKFFNKIVASKSLENYYLLKKGDFAFNKSYSNGYPYGAIKRLDKYDKGAVSTLYICFKPKKVNSNFLKQYFETNKWYKEIYKIAIEGARNHGLLNISISDFFNTKHYIPQNNKEQIKISNFIDIIDEKIELLEKSLILNERVIQSFSNSLFKDLNYKNSEVTILSKICTINKGEQLNKEDMISNGKYYVLNGGKEPSGYTDKWNVCKNTISISEGGNCGYVNFNFKNFWAGGHCYYLSNLKSNIKLYYLYYYLKENQREIMRLRVGSALFNIQKGDIENFKVLVPSFKKQKEISDSLLILNKKLEINRTKLKLLKTFKKGLLQKMFV
ncbi:MAG: restriction endonuclease subunit S [Methanobrevibacter sp.]